MVLQQRASTCIHWHHKFYNTNINRVYYIDLTSLGRMTKPNLKKKKKKKMYLKSNPIFTNNLKNFQPPRIMLQLSILIFISNDVKLNRNVISYLLREFPTKVYVLMMDWLIISFSDVAICIDIHIIFSWILKWKMIEYCIESTSFIAITIIDSNN